MREISYRQALNEALREEMRRDDSVFLMGEDIGIYGGPFGVTKGLIEEFGERRVKDTPISEAAFTGTAVGAAIAGLRPVIEILYIDFTTVAMDQVVNQAAKLCYMTGGAIKLPLVLRTSSGSGTGEAAQHCQSLEAWFIHIPGLKVVMPSTPYDAKGLLKTAIRDDDPVVFIEHKLLYSLKGPIPEEEYVISFGQAEIKKEGDKVTLVATSSMVHKALRAAEVLARDGVKIEVIDPRTLVPFDSKTIIDSVKETGHLIILHEACQRGGIGGEIIRQVNEKVFDYLDSPIKVLAGMDVPIPYASTLEEVAIPREKDIIETVKDMVS